MDARSLITPGEGNVPIQSWMHGEGTARSERMLEPYRVLDLTDEKGLYCGQMLGSLGADVIKVERPGGDPSRNTGPFVHDVPDPENSLFWLSYNANKRGITLDIETARGRELFRKLVRTADVVLESFPVGYLSGLGLAYADFERMNPRVILTSITPFGQSGPHASYKASDLVCWAMGGLLALTGDPDKPPVRTSHIPFAYLMAAMDAAWATAIALYWRGQYGEGQHIDVSIQSSVMRTAWIVREYWNVRGQEPLRTSSLWEVANSDVTLRVVWPVKDGFIRYMIFAGQFGEAENRRLVDWLDDEGIADDFLKSIDWANLDWRYVPLEKVRRIEGYLAKLFGSKTKAQLEQESIKRRIMLQPIASPRDVMEHPQLRAREYWHPLEHPGVATGLLYPDHFCLASETRTGVWRRAPRVGEHNHEVYEADLGCTNKELADLQRARVI